MIPPHEIAAELARESAARRATYPALVERLRMTQEQADYETALCATWAADLARYTPWLAGTTPHTPIAPVLRSHGFTWHERRNGITRELDYRARLYPQWIAKMRLSPAEATQRTARLRAMADLYDEGHDWHDTFGTRPPFGPGMSAPHHNACETEAIAQWWHHVHTTLTTRHGAPAQELLAL